MNFEKGLVMQFHQQIEDFTEPSETLSGRNSSTEFLTMRQFETLEIIRRYVEKFHISPSLREIADEMHIHTINGVRCHLEALERKGYLHPRGNRSRSIALKTDGASENPGIPIQADVARCRLCSRRSGKYLDFSSGRFYARKNYLGIVFHDDNLLKEYSIRRGDCLVIRKTRDISNGELVLVTDRSREVFLVNFCGVSDDGSPIFHSYGAESREIPIVEPKIHGIVEMQIRFPNPRATLLEQTANPPDETV